MKVLVADDSQPIRKRLVERLLSQPGIEVAEAVDTPGALQRIEIFRPDVAVLDIRMPGGGGIKVLETIRASHPDITVIIMTNYPYAQYRRKCLDAGADFFFDKSTEFEKVPAIVQELMTVSPDVLARRTAAAQLVESKEASEKAEQRRSDLSLLSSLGSDEKPSDLMAAHAMWEKTFDAIPDLVALFDAEHRIIRVNRAMADLLNVPAAELTGKKCFEYIHGTTCPAADCPHEAMLRDGQEHRREMFSESLDGWFHVSVSPIYNKTTLVGAIHIARDVTAVRQARLYGEIQHDILQVLNTFRGDQEPVSRVLELLKEKTGFDAVGIRLENGGDFPYFVQNGFSGDFLLTENTLIDRSVDGGVCRNEDGSVRLECTCGLVLSGQTDPSSPLFTPGGSFWINDSFPLLDLPSSQDPRNHPRNNCIHQGYASVALIPIRNANKIIGLIQLNDRRRKRFTLDIIERLEAIASHIGEALARRQAEESVRENEMRYHQLFESMQSGFALHEIICDERGIPCDYRFLEVNPAFEKLTGLKAADMIGKTVKEIMPETEPVWIETYGKVALTGVPVQIDDFSGELGRHYSVSAYSPRKGQFATVFADITAQKAAEETVIRARDTAEAASLEKTQFLANMSHELRTPLNAIIGFSELLQFSELDEEQRDQIETIGASGNVMLALVSDLLDISRIELGKIEIKNEAFDIRKTVSETIALLSQQAGKKGVELTGTVEESVPEKITSDPARLQQVLVNLLNNSLKFTEKGFVRLTVRSRALPSGSRRIEFAVEDSGEGISAVFMKRIFEPFQQGDNSNTRKHGGAGLGLAISKDLVKLMGGDIRVESRQGEGSCFSFFVQDHISVKNAVAAGEVRKQWSGRCICVWSDDPADMRAAEHLLERCGAFPRYAETLDAIYEKLTCEVPADAVLCNLDLPDLAERLAEFRKLRPDVPWIAFSNWAHPPDEQTKNCFAEFIDRPLKADPLYGALARIHPR
ncbi:MAG: response regulator [Kiritimatiellaceae bacterium]|nr:response regulator [Kiritimatiellaceae bacterium]